MSHVRIVGFALLLYGGWWLSIPFARSQSTPLPTPRVVFVAGGAGDSRQAVTGMERAVAQSGLPLSVAAVNWASGDVAEDIQNWERHQRSGRALAQRVLAYHKAYPGCKIYLVGHSAGSAVILAATRELPAHAVERIVLLAPGVSSHHDLRRALGVSRCGIDHFYSRHDDFLTGCVDRYGTTDGRGIRAAGEVGFAPIITNALDVQLYRNLRQHPWRKEHAHAGNDGGHFGVVRPTFLAQVVLPLFAMP